MLGWKGWFQSTLRAEAQYSIYKENSHISISKQKQPIEKNKLNLQKGISEEETQILPQSIYVKRSFSLVLREKQMQATMK